jgi:DNA-binding transcriptional MerR regulator
MTKILSIGELARATNTPAETIRYYEKIGLIDAPARTDSNYRSYSEGDRARLRFVRRARELGFAIDQVRTLLHLTDNRDHDCTVADDLVRENLVAVERKIADLNALKEQLLMLKVACRGHTAADCQVIGALVPSEDEQ